jgi:hypothetical protein
MKEPKRESVAVLCSQTKKCVPIIVIGEHRFTIVSTIYEMETAFFGPLQ